MMKHRSKLERKLSWFFAADPLKVADWDRTSSDTSGSHERCHQASMTLTWRLWWRHRGRFRQYTCWLLPHLHYTNIVLIACLPALSPTNLPTLFCHSHPHHSLFHSLCHHSPLTSDFFFLLISFFFAFNVLKFSIESVLPFCSIIAIMNTDR